MDAIFNMEKFVSCEVLNSTLTWDETVYSSFYHLYNIEPIEIQNFGNDSAENISSTRISRINDIDNSRPETQFEFAVDGVGIVLMSLLGIIGNAVSGWILSRPKMRSSINCLLLGLAVADSVFIGTTSLILGVPTILSFFDLDFSVIALLTPVIYPVCAMAHMASIYLTLAVTMERYVAVCHPLHARSEFTWKQARYIVLAIVVLSVAYNIPRFWEYSVGVLVNSNNDTVRYVMLTTPLRRHVLYDKVYVFTGYFLLLYLLPLLALIVFNSLIYRAVRIANKERKNMSKSERGENQLARMLVMVVLVFIVCNALGLVGVILKISTGNHSLIGVDSLRNFFINFNSSINFVIYCAYGERFRDLFFNMWPQFVRKWYFRGSRLQRMQAEHSGSSKSSIDKSRRQSTNSTVGSIRLTGVVIDIPNNPAVSKF